MFFQSVPWRFFILATLIIGPSVAKAQVSEKDEFLETVRKAHALLEKKCMQNIRVEESVEIYTDGVPTPPGKSVTFLGTPDSFLYKTSEVTKDGKGFVERVKVTRPDGRYILAKLPDGPYVLGGVSAPKPPIDDMDHFFRWVFPFFTPWTGGKVIDLLSAKTTTFKVVRKDASGIEIEITGKKEEPKSPFNLFPMRIVLDEQTYALKSVRGRQTLTGKYISMDAEYTDGFPTAVMTKNGPEEGALKVVRVHKFPVYRTEVLGNSAFSLSQFGIPEPNQDFRRPWYGSLLVWFLAAGMLAVVAFIVVRRRLNPL